MSSIQKLFYEYEGKRYALSVNTHDRTVKIERKASNGYEAMKPETASLYEFCVLQGLYWVEDELYELIGWYESELPRIPSPHFTDGIPDWALDLTDEEISDAVKLRNLIQAIHESNNVTEMWELAEKAQSLGAPDPAQTASLCIVLLFLRGEHLAALHKVKEAAAAGLHVIARYTPDEPGS